MSKLKDRTNRKAAGAVRGLTIPARRIAAALLSVMLLSGAAVAWSAAANAGTGHATTPAAKTVRPDDLTVTLLFSNGDQVTKNCSAGTTYPINEVVTEVENSCNWRVWLHQNNNNTGVNFCVSAVMSGYPPGKTYANLYISNNDDACTVP